MQTSLERLSEVFNEQKGFHMNSLMMSRLPVVNVQEAATSVSLDH